MCWYNTFSQFYTRKTVDYTWKVNDVGKSRLVVFPGDPNFVVGTYMIGVFSAVPARFEIVADVSGGAYSSESVRNVERLTAKFNTVAEGFIKVQSKKPKPKSKVKIPRENIRTAKERAEAFAEEQANAEVRLKQLRESVGQKVRKISKVRARHIARLEKELERSKRERESLITSFNVEPTAALESDVDDYASDDEDEGYGEADKIAGKGESVEQDTKEQVAKEELKAIIPEPSDDGFVHQQNVAEILRALQDEESASSDDDTDEDESAVAVPSALLSSTITPLQMWRPLSKVRAPPHNTFIVDGTNVGTANAKAQKYELTKRKR